MFEKLFSRYKFTIHCCFQYKQYHPRKTIHIFLGLIILWCISVVGWSTDFAMLDYIIKPHNDLCEVFDFLKVWILPKQKRPWSPQSCPFGVQISLEKKDFWVYFYCVWSSFYAKWRQNSVGFLICIFVSNQALICNQAICDFISLT